MITVTLPKLGEMTEDAVLIDWEVAVGDRVAAGDALASVETDKVEAEVPSPVAGTITELLAEPDDELAVGAPLCTIEPEA